MKNFRLIVLAVFAVACLSVEAQAAIRPLHRAKSTVKGAWEGFKHGGHGHCHNGSCRPHHR